MVSYQSTSEFPCVMSSLDNHIESCADQNTYYNPNFETHQDPLNVYGLEDELKQQLYPTPELITYDTADANQTAAFGNNHFCDFPQYNSIQYTPLTPEPISYPVFQIQPPQPQSHQYNKFMLKKHHAHINIAETSKGVFKAVVKRKRKRTVFTTEQVEALEEIFKTRQYISREDRQDIVQKLQLNDKAVKIWFQNRRLKIKRMSQEEVELEQEDCTRNSVQVRSSPDTARLDLVESQICNKTDEFGYVTLDDVVMGDLANVIDEFLINSVNIPVEETVEYNSRPIYEPISPASVTDSNTEDSENSLCWRPSEPNESLQRLFDLQAMLSS